MSKLMNVLKPLYDDDKEVLKFLVVSESEIGRGSVGKALLSFKEGKNYSIVVHTRKFLPKSKKRQCPDEHFDFIVFVIDLKDEKGLENIQDSLGYIDLEYFLGKCCFVVLHDDSEICNGSEIEQMENFYRTPAFYANLSNENEIKGIVSQILTNAEVSCGLDSFENCA